MLLLYTEPLVKKLRSYPRFQTIMQEALGEHTKVKFTVRKYKKSLFDDVLEQHKEKLEQLMSTEHLS